MTTEEVFELVRSIVLEILPDIQAAEIRHDSQLVDLGANSLDRMEVVTEAMEQMNLRIPPNEFAGIRNISGLVEVLYRHQNK
jgi:polyketide biosynthesis acyl carrier protein